MFIRYYLELPFSADQVEAALLAEVGSAHSATGSAGESRPAWARRSASPR
jgi:hypothetical protein